MNAIKLKHKGTHTDGDDLWGVAEEKDTVLFEHCTRVDDGCLQAITTKFLLSNVKPLLIAHGIDTVELVR